MADLVISTFINEKRILVNGEIYDWSEFFEEDASFISALMNTSKET